MMDKKVKEMMDEMRENLMHKLMVKCCVCERFRINNEWVEYKEPEGVDISHTYCDHCYLQERVKMRMNNILKNESKV